MATIANYRNNLLHSSATRVGTTLGEGITSTIPAFIEPKGSTTLVPSTATITVDTGNYTNPTYTWYTVVNGSTVTLISGQTTKTYTLPAATFKTVVSTYNLVTYRVVLSQTGYPNKVLEYTIALVREGTDSAVFGINNAAAIFTKNTAGSITPSSIELTTTAVNMSSITSYQWLKDGAVISGATSASYSVPNTDFTSVKTHQYTCNVTGTVNGVAGTVLTDNITIPRLDEVGSAPTPTLTNENVSFPAPVSGYSGITFTNGASVVEMYLGATKLTYAASGANTFNCTNASTGATVASGTGSGSAFTVPAPTAMSADAAYTDVTINYRDSLGVANSVVRRITYALARAGIQGNTGNTGNTGSAGANAALLNITTAGALFTKNTSGTITPSTITLATAVENITSITGYQWYKDAVLISGATASTYAVPSSDYTSVNTHIYRCVVSGTVNGVAGSTREDSITIPRLDDSGTGPTAVLSNERISFTAPTSGFSGITFTGGSCTVELYLGATKLTYAASGANTFSCTNATTSATVAVGSGTASTFTVPAPTAMSADAAYTDVTITYRDAAGTSNVITKRINYSLTRAGAQGTTGNTGNTGATGTRGNLELYSTDVAYNSTYTYLSFAAGAASYAAKATALIAAAAAGSTPTTPIQNDTVNFSNGSTYVYTITYNSAAPAWQTPGQVIDGSLLVTESVTANKIDTRGLTIKDGSGNVIMQAGSSIDWTKLGSAASNLSGLGYTGALNATYGAAIGTNLTGQFTSSNATTFFANAAINTAQIGELDAIKLVARSIKTDKIEVGAATANATYLTSSVVNVNPGNTTGLYTLTSSTVQLNNMVPGSKVLIVGKTVVSIRGWNTGVGVLRYQSWVECDFSYDNGATWGGSWYRIPGSGETILYNEAYTNPDGGTRNFTAPVPIISSYENPSSGAYVATNMRFRFGRSYAFSSSAASTAYMNPNGNVANFEYTMDRGGMSMAIYEFKV